MTHPTPLLKQLHIRASSTEISAHNHIHILQDSTENFPEWLNAIKAAKHYVLIEMYIFAADEFGQILLDLLVQKQQQGIQVVLVYDWLGSIVPSLRNFFHPLRKAGALVVAYNPIGFASGLGLLSRNHRKAFVIDGHTAFVSGLCISSAWQGQPEKNIAPWRDTGVKLQGVVVNDVIAAIADSLESQKQKLPNTIDIVQHNNTGTQRAGIVATTPSNNNMMRLDLNALALANHHLWLTDAYFMPTRLYTQTLINAANAGVDVRILVPKTSDIQWIARVSRTRYRELLLAGVRIFEWNVTMIHAKSAIADGKWARVGSTNLNFASWHFNRELDVIIEDENTVSQLEHQFLRDLQNATEIVLNDNENASMQEARKLHFSQLKTLNRAQAHAVARQVMHLSQAFKGNFYGTQIIDETETHAFLYLGLTLLFGALLLWFFPYLLIAPIMLLLLASGISTTIFAIKRMRQLKK